MVRLTDRPDMPLDVYRGRKTTKQQQQQTSFLSQEGFTLKESSPFGVNSKLEGLCQLEKQTGSRQSCSPS